ncbi:MAG: tetratricopeptide repeat protein [Bacteroidetes bacterium]|nr:MAG: tetratricopeptide repeat protein [Bacteroidota bacterium]
MTERLSHLFHFLEASPTDSFTLYSIAYEYMNQGKYQEALSYFERLKSVDPAYVGLYYHLGHTLIYLGKPSDAMIVFREGIEVARQKRDFHAQGELQRALTQAEDEAEA